MVLSSVLKKSGLVLIDCWVSCNFPMSSVSAMASSSESWAKPIALVVGSACFCVALLATNGDSSSFLVTSGASVVTTKPLTTFAPVQSSAYRAANPLLSRGASMQACNDC